MEYKKLCETYEQIKNTTKGLEKTSIISNFLSTIKENPKIIYLLQGKIFADYDKHELGISWQLSIKIITRATGVSENNIIEEFKNLGCLGLVIEKIIQKKKQIALFSKKLTIKKIFENLEKLSKLKGNKTTDKKLNLIVELILSASPLEAKYIIRTIIGDLKIGIGPGLIRDAITETCFKPKNISEKKIFAEKVQAAYNKSNDFALTFQKACEKKLEEITLSPGKPTKVMLFPKAKNIKDAFKIVGKPAAFEYKYDGFRMMVNKDSDEIKIFTRRLDNVTKQFPEVIAFFQEHIKGENFIIDCEAVGYNPETKKHKPFQYISQRIKRKYDIEKLIKKLPIEINIFDILFYNNKNLTETMFEERRKILEKIIIEKKWKIKLAKQIITSDENEVEKFYEKAIEEGQEGLMAKNLNAKYKPGARIGYAVKLKPEDKEIDLVISGAEWGTGKRTGWLTSFNLSCQDEDGNLQSIGSAGSGLKEKKEQGLSFEELTQKLKKIIIEKNGRKIKVKPEIVVSVKYQNIQKSPTYSSGYALRFPRITALRPDRGVEDIANTKEIKTEISSD